MSRLPKPVLKKILEEYQEYLEQYFEEKNKRTLSKTPKAIVNRARFSVNGAFSGPLIKNRFLCQVWGKSKIKSNSNYNRISSVNRKFCMEKSPSEQNVISPPGGFLLNLVNKEYKPENLRVKIEPVRLNKNEKKLICLLYICCFDPVLSTRRYCVYFDVKEATFKETEAEFEFNGKEKTMTTWYRKHIFYLCAATLNKNENVVRWSDTVVVNSDEPVVEDN